MIHYFSISNYYSVREKVTLDLRIPRTAPDLPGFRQSKARPDIRLPSVAVLMGPNGSGKTTLLRALVDAVRFASTPWRPDQKPLRFFIPFFSATTQNEPTRFCVEFEADWLAPDKTPELFRYQFSVEHHEQVILSKTVLEEALFHFPKNRARRLFERGDPGQPIYVSEEFGIKPGDGRLLGVREDASVISTLAFLNIPLAKRIEQSMQPFLTTTNILYFHHQSPETKDIIDLIEKNLDIKEWIELEIQRSDLAIQDISVENGAQGNKQVLFKHRGLNRPVHLYLESGGTKRLFHLLPQIHLALSKGIPAVLDEVDGDLHVDIVNDIFHRFRSQETNSSNAQLLATSHNVGLLEDLVKEELFIVEKGKDGETRVHGAQDVDGLRRDVKLYPKYRAGTLGGIPNLG